jgi:predicted DsbA family dithiol-disulfide isomerase
VRAVSTANFAEDRQIADASVVRQILSELGLPVDRLEHALRWPRS